MTDTWEAKGKNVFQGSSCIGIFDTDDGSDSDSDREMERRARLAAAAPRLLGALKVVEMIAQHSHQFAGLLGFQNVNEIRKIINATEGK